MRGLGPGDHLSAEPLAQAFGLSRKPVARALDLLVAVGAAERRAHRGVFVADLAAFDPQELQSGEDRLYWRLVNDRLDDALPDALDEAALMRRYGAPRRLVARVLARLAEEGVARRRPGVGWAFEPLLRGPAQVAASLRFRLLTEPAAFDEPGFAAPADALAVIMAEQRALAEEAERPGRSILNFERNARFHEALAAWSGNPFLLDAARRHSQARRLVQYRAFVKPGRLRQSSAEHLGVLDAVAAGDLAAARARLIAHLEGAPTARGAGPAPGG